MAIFQENYFDLWQVFVNEIVGDIWIFIIIGLILLVYFSIKANFPFEVTIMFSVLWLSLVFSKATSLIVIWAFIVLFIGGLFYYTISKALKG